MAKQKPERQEAVHADGSLIIEFDPVNGYPTNWPGADSWDSLDAEEQRIVLERINLYFRTTMMEIGQALSSIKSCLIAMDPAIEIMLRCGLTEIVPNQTALAGSTDLNMIEIYQTWQTLKDVNKNHGTEDDIKRYVGSGGFGAIAKG